VGAGYNVMDNNRAFSIFINERSRVGLKLMPVNSMFLKKRRKKW